jgi:serine phosphatase RsbU (regulator of sigma subunit)
MTARAWRLALACCAARSWSGGRGSNPRSPPRRRGRRALEDDLDLAARIQGGLLPKPGRFAGWEAGYHYQPAGVVSGDYCDLIGHGDGTGELVFLVGDVSGKGVAAAMLVSHLHAMFQSLIGVGMPVECLVERANQHGELELCNAGHCPPLVVRDGEGMAVEAAGRRSHVDGGAADPGRFLKPGALSC